jgi:hypothetical protein
MGNIGKSGKLFVAFNALKFIRVIELEKKPYKCVTCLTIKEVDCITVKQKILATSLIEIIS